MEGTVLRGASANEKRCIIRHHAGFYSNIVAGCTYRIPRGLVMESRLQTAELYVPVIADCVAQHPFLSATIANADTNDPIYTRPQRLDVQDHIRIVDKEQLEMQSQSPEEDETELLRRFLEYIHNSPASKFTSVASRPPWALDLLLLSDHADSGDHRLLASFTYSHSHGDGMSGLIFHQTFYSSLQRHLTTSPTLKSSEIECPSLTLPGQPDTATSVPVSLTYLLRPALGTYLPRFLSRLFGLTGNVSGADDQTWVGSKIFTDSLSQDINATTSAQVLHIEAQVLANTLALCKRKNAKLTALMNLVIARALNTALETTKNLKIPNVNFVATVPINLRKCLNVPPTTIGNYGGTTYLRYTPDTLLSPPSQPDTDPWHLIRAQGDHLSTVSTTPRNQPIGLLRYISNFTSWMHNQIGQSRGNSWELSNLGSFSPDGQTGDTVVITVEQVLFSQPASPIGPPMTFNTVALRNGGLNVCVTWQPGALGLAVDEVEEGGGGDERTFVRLVVASIRRQFEQFAQMS